MGYYFGSLFNMYRRRLQRLRGPKRPSRPVRRRRSGTPRHPAAAPGNREAREWLNRAEARRWAESGGRLREQHRWAEAAEAYRKADQRWPDAAWKQRIAQVEQQQRQALDEVERLRAKAENAMLAFLEAGRRAGGRCRNPRGVWSASALKIIGWV